MGSQGFNVSSGSQEAFSSGDYADFAATTATRQQIDTVHIGIGRATLLCVPRPV